MGIARNAFSALVANALGLAGLLGSSLVAAGDDCAELRVSLHLDVPGASGGVLQLRQYLGDAPEEFEGTARLRCAFDGHRGAPGWALSVKHDPDVLEILDATVEGTDYQTMFGCGFEVTDIVGNETGAGFTSAVAMFCGPIDGFLPPVGDFSVARSSYRVVAEAPVLPPGSTSSEVSTSIRFEDGLQGRGQPVSNFVGYEGQTVVPCVEDLSVAIRFAQTLEFIRGDANYDLRLDISDPVTLLRSKFHGDAPIRCDDAADANDDETIDISDAIYVFGYLFVGGPPPPAPFPDLGLDPTPDDLLCRP